MIALCLEHAAQADNGAFANEQLQALKESGGDRREKVGGRFNWMRHEILARVGGNFYYRTPVIFQLGTVPCVWLTRDERQHLMVNFRMPTLSGSPRASMIDNFWSVPTDIDELVCPPMGRVIEVTYRNGDRFKVEFSEAVDAGALQKKYPQSNLGSMGQQLPYPLTVVEVWETAAGTTFEFGPHQSRIGGVILSECFMSNCGAGIHVDVSEEQLRTLFPEASGDEAANLT
jgi:hypothetical protein